MCEYLCLRFYLGTPGGRAGGTRAGLEGMRGTDELVSYGPWGPGREGTGGAPNAGEGLRGGGPGVDPLTAGGRLGGTVVDVSGRDAGGLEQRAKR